MTPNLKTFSGVVSIAPILYLIGVVVSFGIYLWAPVAIVRGHMAENVLVGVGVALIALATILVFWAQSVSRRSNHLKTHAAVEDFMKGPYKYSRHPGALGLMMMFVGLALVANSLIIGAFAVVFILAESMWFLPIEERALCEKSTPYSLYRQNVRMWF